MRRAAISLLGLMLVGLGCGGGSGRVVSSHGVRVVVPKGWARVRPATSPITDPRTLLVVGTAGVLARSSRCEVAAYRVPAAGAVVVVVGWKSVATAGGLPKPGRTPLKELVAVRRGNLECFAGRGAAADVLLGGKPYQVSLLVGDRAAKRRVSQALAVARSFDRNS